MNFIQTLLQQPTSFEGAGTNHEGQAFVGRLQLEPLANGSAVLLRYLAMGAGDAVFHQETTLLGALPDGRLCLWPAMSELPCILAHTQVDEVAQNAGGMIVLFATGQREDTAQFREEITIELKAGGELVYAHAWGMPGGSFEARSSCALRPQVA